MSNEEKRFSKLELKDAKGSIKERVPEEKSRKDSLRDFDRKMTVDKTIDEALVRVKSNSEQFNRNLKNWAIYTGLFFLIIFLAGHHIFNMDITLLHLFKIFLYGVLPILTFRWVLSKD